MYPHPTVGYLPPDPDPALLAAHLLAGVGSAVLLALGVTALARRRSRSYLLVVLALSALLVRTAVSLLSLFGPLGYGAHHATEHALDAMVATLLLAAVYDARSTAEVRRA